MDIVQIMKDKAAAKKQKILLVEGNDKRVIQAAADVSAQGLAIPVLLGDKEEIFKIAGSLGIVLDGIDIMQQEITEKEINALVERRGHKGMTKEKARETLKDHNAYAALKLHCGEVAGALGGCRDSTAAWMKPVFQIVGTQEGVNLVSSVCFMNLDGRVIFLSDTDFIISPSYQELAQIAINAAQFVHKLGIDPKVAMLSFSTKGSSEHESIEKVRSAYELVKSKCPSLTIDGEIQFDAAFSKSSFEKKCPSSPLKGDANVFIFPEITVGNVLIHALTQITNYEFFGSFPVGLAKPAINGGRGFDAKKIANCIIAAAMQVNA